MEAELTNMASTTHPRLINDQCLLLEHVMECEFRHIVISAATLQLRNNFEVCVFHQSTKSTSKKINLCMP